MHRRQNDGILWICMQKNRSEKGFKMLRSLQIYIERTYGKDLAKKGPTLQGNTFNIYWL